MKRAKGFPCRWECGGRTANISRICDSCWARRDEIRQERMKAKQDREPDPKRVKAGKESRRARMAVFEQELPDTGLSGSDDG